MPKSPIKQTTTGAQRQKEYVARLKDKGYVLLTSMFVPQAILDECRALVKKRVAKFEKDNTQL